LINLDYTTYQLMPLYMDFHQFDAISVEDVKQAHIADRAVQERYGVRYLQFWVNEQAGTVFCLVEGPDAESCEECHKEAHGNIPCNITEVEPGFFKLFMGDGQPIDHGLAMNREGKLDSANRTILVADIRGITSISTSQDYKRLVIPTKPKNLVVDAFAAFNGRFIEHSTDDSLVGVFQSPINAIRCATRIQKNLLKLAEKHGKNSEWNVAFRLALTNGQPLTHKEGFFEVAIKQAKRLGMIADTNQIVLSANLRDLYTMETEASESVLIPASAKVLSQSEEVFLHELFELTEKNFQKESFNVNNLCKLIGISRPQLYRKTSALTGKSPNTFIRDLRMQKAWNLLKERNKNISEVALEVGYSNPSYFSKVFYERFGHTPSSLMAS
jgi:AraC-like DNA-binding protein